MAMISLHKIEWVIKFKLMTSNRDLKLKLIKLKNLSSFYTKISTVWERERERERERENNNQVGKNGPNMQITNFNGGKNKI